MQQDNVLQELLSILTQKKKCLADVVLLTEKTNFQGIEDDIPPFANYIEEREKILSVCRSLDSDYSQLVKALDLDELVNNNIYKKVESVQMEVSDLARKIVTLDKSINDKMSALFEDIKAEVEKINNGKRLNKGYLGYSPTSSATFFDRKN